MSRIIPKNPTRERMSRDRRNGLLTSTDEVCVFIAFIGEGTVPSRPFSNYQNHLDAVRMWFSTRISMPMPRLTYSRLEVLATR